MQLLIMRHGEAESPVKAGLRDEDRQLTSIGHQQTLRAGEVLKRDGFMPESCWVSPYTRAQQTACNVLQAYENIPSITRSEITPEGNVGKIIDLLSALDVQRLLLVSHQPLVGNLVARLTGNDVFTVPSMAPASMVLLEADAIYAGLCDIVWHRHSPGFELQF